MHEKQKKSRAKTKSKYYLLRNAMCIATIKWRRVTGWSRDKTEVVRRVNETREF